VRPAGTSSEKWLWVNLAWSVPRPPEYVEHVDVTGVDVYHSRRFARTAALVLPRRCERGWPGIAAIGPQFGLPSPPSWFFRPLPPCCARRSMRCQVACGVCQSPNCTAGIRTPAGNPGLSRTTEVHGIPVVMALDPRVRYGNHSRATRPCVRILLGGESADAIPAC